MCGKVWCYKISQGRTAVCTCSFILQVLLARINKNPHSAQRSPSSSGNVTGTATWLVSTPSASNCYNRLWNGDESIVFSPDIDYQYWCTHGANSIRCCLNWQPCTAQGLSRCFSESPFDETVFWLWGATSPDCTHALDAEEMFYEFLTLPQESCWPGGCSAPTGRWTQAVGCAHVWKHPPASCWIAQTPGEEEEKAQVNTYHNKKVEEINYVQEVDVFRVKHLYYLRHL